MSYFYHSSDTQFDFDESDNAWINPTDRGSFMSTPASEAKKSVPPAATSSSRRRPLIKNPKSSSSTAAAGTGGRSLPVNIPVSDWRLKMKPKRAEEKSTDRFEEYEDEDEDEDDDEGGEGFMGLAPHEYLARTRAASLSVHEGVGRTLKGRDLSRVRDAIWKHTGFED